MLVSGSILIERLHFCSICIKIKLHLLKMLCVIHFEGTIKERKLQVSIQINVMNNFHFF